MMCCSHVRDVLHQLLVCRGFFPHLGQLVPQRTNQLLYHNYISIKNETEMVIEQKVKDGNAEY